MGSALAYSPRALTGFLDRITRSPRRILIAGLLGFMLYAFPGFMSFDSVYQLNEARSGSYSDGHPPAMAMLWRIVEVFVTGPAGMLVLQSVAFIAGTYLVFRTRMSQRAAAIAASLVLWFPPVAAVMAVIWKDSQMTGYLLLGLGLMLQERRRTRLWGLAALVLATAMRHNALIMTFPLILLCFVWDPKHRFVKRHLIALAAFVAVTFSAQLISKALTDKQKHIWVNSLAMCDIAATLRFVDETIPDDELRKIFDGTLIMVPRKNLHEYARRDSARLESRYVDVLWATAYTLFVIPRDAAERAAMTRAWKEIVFTHKDAYLTYRWGIFRRLLGLEDEEMVSPIYNWFLDIQDLEKSKGIAEHDAYSSRIQEKLRLGIHVVGASGVFRIMVYVILAFALLPFVLRDRLGLALLGSAFASQASLFFLSPTTDWRYSYWLIVATVITLVITIARRAGNPPPNGL